MILVDLRYFLLGLWHSFLERLGIAHRGSPILETDIRLRARRAAFGAMVLIMFALAAASFDPGKLISFQTPRVLSIVSILLVSFLLYTLVGVLGTMIKRPLPAYLAASAMGLAPAAAISIVAVSSLNMDSCVSPPVTLLILGIIVSISLTMTVPPSIDALAEEVKASRHRIRRVGASFIWDPFTEIPNPPLTRSSCLLALAVPVTIAAIKLLSSAFTPRPAACTIGGLILMMAGALTYATLHGLLVSGLGIAKIQKRYPSPLRMPEFYPGSPW